MKLPKIFQQRGKKSPLVPFCKRGIQILPSFYKGGSGRIFSKKGFTLIEVVIGMAIIAFLAGLGLFLSMDFYRGYSFNYERSLIVASLQKARSRAMANINQTPHGVYFDNDTHHYVIFQGTDYEHRDTTKDESFSASRTIVPSGLQEVVFEQLSGNAASTTLSLSGEGKTAPISINGEGAIIW